MNPSELEERPYERLRRMLDRAGITNKDLAARTGAANETISRWRSGVQAISDDDLSVVIDMLNERGVSVTRGWIRYGEVAVRPPDPGAAQRGAQIERPDVPAPRPGAKAAPKKKRA